MSDLSLQQLKALRFWQTPEITSLNRLPAHAPLHSYRSLADAMLVTHPLAGDRWTVTGSLSGFPHPMTCPMTG